MRIEFIGPAIAHRPQIVLAQIAQLRRRGDAVAAALAEPVGECAVPVVVGPRYTA